MEEKASISRTPCREKERGGIERPLFNGHQHVSKLYKVGIPLLILVIAAMTLVWHFPMTITLAQSFRHLPSTNHYSGIKETDDWWCEGDATTLGRPQRAKSQYEKCSSTVASKTQHFDFNLTAHAGVDQVWRFIDGAPAELRGRLRGEIIFDRGDPSQASDIQVLIVVASSKEADLENLSIYKAYPGLAMSYNTTNENDVCTDIQVHVFLRPGPSQLLHILEVRTEVLNIAFRDNLNWEVDNLIGHSTYGDSDYDIDGDNPLLTHDVTASSWSGELMGRFTADGHINIRNGHGPTGFFLKPLKGRPFKLESLSVFTWSGKIHIWTCFPGWPVQPQDHLTSIYTWSGELWAYIPHGRFTALISEENFIVARIRPYGTADPSDTNTLITHSVSGYTHIRVHETETKDGLYDPLSNMTSKHIQGEGTMELIYPDTWYGTLLGVVRNGPLRFDSTPLEDFERGEDCVRAKKGKIGNSEFTALVDDGELDIALGVN